MSAERVTVVVVAFGAEAWLESAVDRCLASTGVLVDVVVVDNGCTDGGVERLETRPGVHLVRPGSNLGFAAGCNAGVAAADPDSAVIALVNPDALVEPDALAALTRAVQQPGVAIATASVRLADRPELVNSAGNPIHLTGASWSGGFEEPATAHSTPRDVAAASGAAMAVRRDVWEDLGGFAAEFFAYYEDAELSWRAWMTGRRVVLAPDAVVNHRYEFSRNAGKLGMAERNRSLLVLTCWGPRLLVATLPLLVGLEAMTLGLAISQGWAREKVGSWLWLIRHRRWIRQRRARLQSARTRSDRELASLLAVDLAPGNVAVPRAVLALNRGIRAYWKLARRLL